MRRGGFIRWRRSSLTLVTVITMAVLIGGCTPGARTLGVPMSGDTGFDESALPAEVVPYYQAVFNTLRRPDYYPNALAAAQTGNLYQLGRVVNVHVTTLLTLFRYTHDLRLLDAVDVPMQAARAVLSDSNGDGYRNWRWLQDPRNPQWYGDDYHVMDEIMTHGLVAAVAWAYQNNRRLDSPGGVDYGERADFWRRYLKNDFEPKWQARNNVSDLRYLRVDLMHPYLQEIRYYHYMGLLTADSGYTQRAERLAEDLREELHEVPTDTGLAYVWGMGLRSKGSAVRYVQPTLYANYTVQTMQDLALEGMAPFADPEFMTEVARTVTSFILDNGSEDFSIDIAGNRAIAGLDPAPHVADDAAYERATRAHWSIMSYSSLAHYDPTGAIAAVNEAVFRAMERSRATAPQRIYIPAAFVISGLASLEED
jgi:hypothetical protein